MKKSGWKGLSIPKLKNIMALGRGSATCQAGISCNPVRLTKTARVIKNSI